LRQRWVQVLVRLAFDDQHAKPKPVVALNDRIVEVLAQTFGDFGNRQCGQLPPQSTHFSVESVSSVSVLNESFESLSIKWFGSCPNPKPREPICFREELVRICVLAEGREAEENRERNTNVADHVKVPHDIIPVAYFGVARNPRPVAV
jgi:hypothetical protein